MEWQIHGIVCVQLACVSEQYLLCCSSFLYLMPLKGGTKSKKSKQKKISGDLQTTELVEGRVGLAFIRLIGKWKACKA